MKDLFIFIINSLLLLPPYIISIISSNNNYDIQLYSHQIFIYLEQSLILLLFFNELII